jgi:hypothetical protein
MMHEGFGPEMLMPVRHHLQPSWPKLLLPLEPSAPRHDGAMMMTPCPRPCRSLIALRT